MKVLVIGPRFHYFNQSVESAFAALGHEVKVVAYDNPVHPYSLANKIRYKLSSDKDQMKKQSREASKEYFETAFSSFMPDLVFMMNGDMVSSELIGNWKKRGAKTVLWLFDSVKRMPLAMDNVPYVDKVFCYEQSDIELLKNKYGVVAKFLPQAVDTNLYYPLTDKAEKEYDIVFAGDIYHSKKRTEIVQKLVAHYPNLRIRIWGEYKPWYKNPLKWMLRERRDVYTNKNASAEQLNLDYNRSKIVLNIHHEQQKDGANPKVSEICASGAYQICDANPYISNLFPDGQIGLYDSVEALFGRIDYALSHDMSEKAHEAYKTIVEQHTFINRINKVLQEL